MHLASEGHQCLYICNTGFQIHSNVRIQRIKKIMKIFSYLEGEPFKKSQIEKLAMVEMPIQNGQVKIRSECSITDLKEVNKQAFICRHPHPQNKTKLKHWY